VPAPNGRLDSHITKTIETARAGDNDGFRAEAINVRGESSLHQCGGANCVAQIAQRSVFIFENVAFAGAGPVRFVF
jgi:hypothetical protein